jgi:phosphoribosyl-ATP pyrophosphohydrolase
MIDPDVYSLILKVSNENKKSLIPQEVYVTEECSELIKAISKISRQKGSEENLFDESCDVIAATMVMLYQHYHSEKEVTDRIKEKYIRAVQRYKKLEY